MWYDERAQKRAVLVTDAAHYDLVPELKGNEARALLA